MTKNTTFEKIINTCIETETFAIDTYKSFAGAAASEELSAFWAGMVEEEKKHLQYWETLLDYAERDMIPPVFKNPETVLDELKEILPKAETFIRQPEDISNTSKQFFTAYRLEFYMLHSAYATLFHIMDYNEEVESPVSSYEEHLSSFAGGLIKFGVDSPELELLGETMQRLWVKNRKLVTSNTTDPLTGILNRAGLFQAITPLSYLAGRHNHTIGVMMIDIDNFKMINDTYGHLRGDDILCNVATAIKEAVRRSDVVGRFGGEEFLVFLPSVEPGHTPRVGEKIRLAVQNTETAGLSATISVGVREDCIGGDIDRDLQRMIKEADDALYTAKRSGKNRVESAGTAKGKTCK